MVQNVLRVVPAWVFISTLLFLIYEFAAIHITANTAGVIATKKQRFLHEAHKIFRNTLKEDIIQTGIQSTACLTEIKSFYESPGVRVIKLQEPCLLHRFSNSSKATVKVIRHYKINKKDQNYFYDSSGFYTYTKKSVELNADVSKKSGGPPDPVSMILLKFTSGSELKESYPTMLLTTPVWNFGVFISTMLFSLPFVLIYKRRKTLSKQSAYLKSKLQNTIRNLKSYSFINSHDLRAPLTNLRMIYQSLGETGEEGQYPDQLKALLQTVDDLLETTELSAINLQLRHPVHETKSQIRYDSIFMQEWERVHFPGRQHASVEIDRAGPGTILFYPVYLHWIFRELIKNSVHFKPTKRRLRIRLRSRRTQRATVLEYYDNSEGFDSRKHKHRLFSLNSGFHPGKSARGESLFLARQILDYYGCGLHLESRPDEGTVITILFKENLNA